MLRRFPTFASPRAARWGGVRHALGVPGLALGASYLGFGALVHESHLTLWHGLLSTATGWALPGQIALVELYGLGATLMVIAVAVGLSGARLLPMTMTLLPLLRTPEVPRWRFFLVAHFIAITGWAVATRASPHMPREQRLAFFLGFTVTLWVISLICTALGYLLPGALPERVSLALLFLNPIYFLCIFLVDLGSPARLWSFLSGLVLGPALFLLTPDWSLLLTGLIGGTLAFWLGRRRRR